MLHIAYKQTQARKKRETRNVKKGKRYLLRCSFIWLSFAYFLFVNAPPVFARMTKNKAQRMKCAWQRKESQKNLEFSTASTQLSTRWHTLS